METVHQKRNAYLAVAVSALGYFVDIYDLLLFSIVRVASLRSIGVADSELLQKGVLLIDCQMAGLLSGGVLWGIIGDKKGRLSVLFGSIFMYSVANILNGFANTVEQYAVLRFLAGVGLAGELGAGITLVSELLPKHTRGWGTTIVASFGILGAVIAALIGDLFDWRTAYFVGGAMGMALLVLRVSLSESGIFKTMKDRNVKAGNFFALFTSRRHLVRYLSVVVVGVPIWCTIGILITFSPELGKAFHMVDLPTAGKAVMSSYIGLSLGDLSSGFLSQMMKNRKRVVGLFLLLLAAVMTVYFVIAGQSLLMYYFMCILLGFATGYWALFVTIASEQFGTNIRATVTTTAPNFVRGSVIPFTLGFQALQPSLGVIGSAMVVCAISLVLSAFALLGLEETFGKDLAYVEEFL